MKTFGAFFAACLGIFTLEAQNTGCFDPALGDKGFLKIETGVNYEAANGITFQPDGKIIVCAESDYGGLTVHVQRFHPDGSLDTTFGSGGTAPVNLDKKSGFAGNVLVLPNGKIVASYGYNYDLHKIYMLKADGAPELSFGQNGSYSIPGTSIFSAPYCSWLSAMPDGRFVACTPGNKKITLVRFSMDGALDPSFGAGGVSVTSFPEYPYADFIPRCIQTTADGSIFVGGKFSENNGDPLFILKFKPDGQLDTSFGVNGRIVQYFEQFSQNAVRDIRILSDGSIIALAESPSSNKVTLSLLKYTATGAVFPGFGQNGIIREVQSTGQAAFNDLLQTSDGNLLIGGRIGADMIFTKYSASGQKIGTYGSNGTQKFSFGSIGSSECRQFAINPFNEKIYAVGYTVCSIPGDIEYLDNNDADIVMVRLNADGTPDVGFGNNGRVKSIVNHHSNQAKGLLLQSDGRIITVSSASTLYGTTLMRFFPDGSQDRSFGNFGKVHLNLSVLDPDAVTLDNGRILVTGTQSNQLVIWRLLNNGSPDPVFGTKGLAKLTDIFSEGHAIETSGGKIIVAGCIACLYDAAFLVARFNENGTLDTGFGTNGKVTTQFGTKLDIGKFIKIRSNGKIVVIGRAELSSSFPALLQLNANGSVDNGFGTAGKVILNAPNKYSYVKDAELLPDGKIMLTDDTDLFAARLLENGALDPSFSQNGWVERYDVRHNTPVNSNTMALLGDRMYYAGLTSIGSGVRNAVMIARSSAGGAVYSPCGQTSTVFYGSLFGGYSEEIKVLKADSDRSLLTFGEYVPNPLSTTNTQLFLSRFIPEPPVQIYALPDVINVTPIGTTINSFLVAGECNNWTITEDVPWITSISPATGSGVELKNTSIYCTQNTSTTPRTATLTLSGCGASRTITVVQTGVELSTNSTSISVAYQSGSTTLQVVGSCSAWTLSETASWLSVSPGSGSQNKTVTITFEANPNSNARSTTLRLEGCGVTVNISVTQDGTNLNFSSTGINVNANANTFNTMVTGYCASWNISIDSAWLTANPTQGSGSKTIALTCTRNPYAATRSTKVKVTGCNATKTLTFTQAGATLTVSGNQLDVKALPGTGTIGVSGTCGSWTATTNDPWLSISPAAGNAPDSIVIRYNGNLSPNERIGTVIVSGCGILQTITVNQAGALLAINNSIFIEESPAGNYLLNIAGTCNEWQFISNAPWITATPASGNGPMPILVSLSANPGTTDRSAECYVNGCGLSRKITVIQYGTNAVLNATPAGFVAEWSAGSANCAIGGTCTNWTLSTTTPWLHLSQTNGNSPANISISFDANSSAFFRYGSINLTGCGQSSTIAVAQKGKSFAAFTATPLKGCAPLVVQFNNQSAGTATSWKWTFEGGTPATYNASSPPPVRYTSPGIYTAHLEVSDGFNTGSVTQTVEVLPVPVAAFGITVQTGLMATFVNQSQHADRWTWSFGDNSPTFNGETPPPHNFPNDGLYIVRLVASNGWCSDTFLQTVTVSTPLAAGFAAAARQGCDSLSVQFINLSSPNANTFVWAFPGGQPVHSNAANPLVFYAKPGRYDVTLTAKSATAEATTAQTGYIYVQKSPPKNFSSNVVPNSPTVQFFTAPSPGTSFYWDFGDGHTVFKANPVHTYDSSGIYTVSMRANNGCITEKVKTVEVPPFTAPDDRAAHPQTNPTEPPPLTVYPNPLTGDWLNLSGQQSGMVHIELIGATGRTILNTRAVFTPDLSAPKIFLGEIPAGIYFLKIDNGQKIGVFRLAIAH